MAEKILSENFSFRNWRFSKWLLGNWKTIKEALKIVVSYGIPYLATSKPVLSGFLAIIVKFVLDGGEYFVKEIKK